MIKAFLSESALQDPCALGSGDQPQPAIRGRRLRVDLGADCAAPRVRAGGRPKKAILPRAESADAAIGAARAGDGGVSGGGDPNLPPGTTARVLTSAVGSETAVHIRRAVGGEREGVAGLGCGAEAGDRRP